MLQIPEREVQSAPWQPDTPQPPAVPATQSPDTNAPAQVDQTAQAEKNLAAFKDGFYDTYLVAKQNTDPRNEERATNLRYLYGNQDVMFDYERDDLYGVESHVTVNNQIRRNVFRRVANLVSQPPQFEVVPTSSTLSAIDKSLTLDKICKAFWRHYKLRQIIREALVLAHVDSCSYLLLQWDWSLGRIEEKDGRAYPQGDIGLTVIPAGQIYLDPLAERLSSERQQTTDARYAIRVQAVPIDTLYENPHSAMRFGVAKTDVVNGVVVIRNPLPDRASLFTHDSSMATPEADLYVTGIGRNPQQEVDDQRRVREAGKKRGMILLATYWEHPNGQFPRGRHVLSMMDKRDGGKPYVLEYAESLPMWDKDHPSGLFPLIQLKDIDFPLLAGGKSRVSEAKGHQDELNSIETQVRTVVERMPPVWLFDKDCGVDEASFENYWITHILKFKKRGNDTELPKMLWPEQIQAFIMTMMERSMYLKREIAEKIETVDPTSAQMGKTPMPARSMQAVLEAQNAQMSDQAVQNEDTFILPLYKLMIRIAQRFFDETRLLPYMNDQNKMSLVRITKEDLHIEDVAIVASSSLPMNQTLMIGRIMQLASMGAFNSPDPKRDADLKADLYSMLQLHLTSEMTQDELDAQYQRSECLAAEMDIDPIIYPLSDNHYIAMREIMRYFKTPQFRNLEEEKRKQVHKKLLDDWNNHAAFYMLQHAEAPISPGTMALANAEKSGASPAQMMELMKTQAANPAPGGGAPTAIGGPIPDASVQAPPGMRAMRSPNGNVNLEEPPGAAKSGGNIQQ